jgi:hypothetical protein
MGNYREGNHREFYPTPMDIGEFLVKEIKKIINEPSEILEPCAGEGDLVDAILKHYKAPILKYDIEPRREDIIEMDYLKTKIEYKKGRICIMNPPFIKAIKFMRKSLEECDYCAMITSVNSIFNIDYDKYDVVSEDISIFRKRQFGDAKVDCAIMVIKKKDLV